MEEVLAVTLLPIPRPLGPGAAAPLPDPPLIPGCNGEPLLSLPPPPPPPYAVSVVNSPAGLENVEGVPLVPRVAISGLELSTGPPTPPAPIETWCVPIGRGSLNHSKHPPAPPPPPKRPCRVGLNGEVLSGKNTLVKLPPPPPPATKRISTTPPLSMVITPGLVYTTYSYPFPGVNVEAAPNDAPIPMIGKSSSILSEEIERNLLFVFFNGILITPLYHLKLKH